MRGRLGWLVAVVLAGGLVAVLLAASGGGPSAPRPAVGRALVADARRRRPAHRQAAGAHASARGAGHSQHVNVLALASERGSGCQKAPPPVPEHPITHPQWLTGVVVTEYYPAPERWFGGQRVVAPGLSGTHSADWLYSARGLAMEGDGVDLQGRLVHIAALGSTGWVDYAGHPTVPVCLGKWSDGFPVWLKGGWRNARGQVTYPLTSGGWANGPGVHTFDYGGVTFAQGASLPLRYYHSVAVDPRLIPLGSRVYIPAYRGVNGGWFVAQDTGGAIRGRHIDVYRPPPAGPDNLGQYLTGQRVLVIPPG